jgi:hypothetical protein
MRSSGHLGLLAAVVWTILPSNARAQGDHEATGGTSRSYNHKNQIGVSGQIGIGYRVLFRYENTDFCGTDGKSVCTNTTPPFAEVGLSFGLSSTVELMTDVRLGLGDDFVPEGSAGPAPRALVISPGLKFYVDDQGSLKFFTSLQLALDLTDWSADGIADGLDVGVRNVNGLLLDLHRTFGVYLFVGETVGVIRWLRFEMDGGIGMQARFP